MLTALALTFATVFYLKANPVKINTTPFLLDNFRPGAASDVLDPSDAEDFAAHDQNRIRGSIAKEVSRSCPFIDILGGGTIEANMSETVRAVVSERAVIGNGSLVRPEFQPIKDLCGTSGGAAKVGTKEYSYFLAGYRDKGPLVCVKVAYHAFRRSYSAAEDTLKSGFVQINNNDVRALLADRSGCKVVVRHDTDFAHSAVGDIQAIDTALPDIGLPTAMLNFKMLKRIGNWMREDLRVEPWDAKDGSGKFLKLFASIDLLDFLRDEAGVNENHRYLAAGSYKVGEENLRKYIWEGPYRGWAFAQDPQPLRYNALDADGNPDFIEPEYGVETSNGWASRPAPAWLVAKYECALGVGMNTFNRLVPEKYTGEGGFKWPAQLVNGELFFQVIKDNDNNAWGDFGRHFFQMERAYEPQRPHAAVLICYKRSGYDLGLTAVDDFSADTDSNSNTSI